MGIFIWSPLETAPEPAETPEAIKRPATTCQQHHQQFA